MTPGSHRPIVDAEKEGEKNRRKIFAMKNALCLVARKNLHVGAPS
jgi:hypothetical protein